MIHLNFQRTHYYFVKLGILGNHTHHEYQHHHGDVLNDGR